MKRQNVFSAGQVAIICLLCLVTGVVLGVGGSLALQNNSSPKLAAQIQNTASGNSVPQPQSTVAVQKPEPGVIMANPPKNGIFLINGNGFVEISATDDDTHIDINALASIADQQPGIAIKGPDFPLGKISIKAYKAGFGLDVTIQSNGAMVNKVYPGTSAEKAGLKAGDLIISVDGKKPVSLLGISFPPAHYDLFGPLHPSIAIEMIHGTTSQTINLPRDYRFSEDPMMEMYSPFRVDFEIETKGEYVILTPKKALASGVYRIAIQNVTTYSGGSSSGVQTKAISTVKPGSNSVPNQKWIFWVK